jgi:mannose-6-phosphate isomerase-like protein (cupin superfamily)
MPGEFSIHQFGPLSTWGDFTGGLSPQTTAPGRRFVEKDLPVDFFGISINSRLPGEGADYWHAHSVLEELYLFLEGEGEMGLDDKVIPVRAGTAVRVGQGVMRTWRATPSSPVPLKWICIRGGGAKLKEIPKDATPLRDRPLPW